MPHAPLGRMAYYDGVPRRSFQTFRSDALDELTRQLLFVPVKTRHEQVRRAEKLHDEIDPQANYPFDYVKYRITRYRDDETSDHVLVGEGVLPDLRLLIDKVTASAPLPMTKKEPAETIDVLASRLNVSVKTIGRWRKQGLRWRWVARSKDDPPCIAVMEEALALFNQRAGDRVGKAKSFSRIDNDVRDALVAQAREALQEVTLSPHQLAVKLAPTCGRAVESIRQLLDDHDRNHPDARLFPDRSHPLTADEKNDIAVAFNNGTKIGALARQYGKTVSSIRRAIYEHRAASLRRLKIQWVTSPTFERKDADEVILRPEPMVALIDAFETGERKAAVPVDDLPESMQPLFAQPTLDHEHQRSLVVRMNYLKFRAANNRDALDRHEPRVKAMNLIQDDLDQAQFIRDRLVACNLPTVLSVGRRHQIGLPDEARVTAALLAILEIGVEVLVEEVVRYDPRRDRTFQRHVTWATMSELSHREADILKTARLASESIKAKARSRTNLRVNRSADRVLKNMYNVAATHDVALPGGVDETK